MMKERRTCQPKPSFRLATPSWRREKENLITRAEGEARKTDKK